MCKVIELGPLHASLPSAVSTDTGSAPPSRNGTRLRARKKGSDTTLSKKSTTESSVPSQPNISRNNQRKKKQKGEKVKLETSRRKGSFGDTSGTSCTSNSSLDAPGCAFPQYVRLKQGIPLVDCAHKLRYVAMDCEMVGIGDDGMSSALARVSVTNWDGNVLLDTYVRVSEPVTDLRADVSGISYCQIDGTSSNTMEFDVAVRRVQEIITGKILVGHGLKNDLRVLNITHPWQDTRDTTKYEPFMRKEGNNLPIPRKLKELTLEKFGVKIQKEGQSHCSVEDAAAAMRLYQAVSKQWEKVIEYKVKKTLEILSMKQQEEEKELLRGALILIEPTNASS